MHPYDKHTSWVISPWNYGNFLLESPFSSLNLDLRKMCEPCNSWKGKSQGKIRESQRTWVPKSHGKSGNLTKNNGWKPWRSVKQFCGICKGESLFSKSKVTNLKNPREISQKSIYILKHSCLEFFWNSPYSRGRDVLYTAISQGNLQIGQCCNFLVNYTN